MLLGGSEKASRDIGTATSVTLILCCVTSILGSKIVVPLPHTRYMLAKSVICGVSPSG